MSTTTGAPAALPPPPAPPVPPGGSAPPPPPPGGGGAPLAHVSAGHSAHGSHGHALRPPRLGAQRRRETRSAGRQAPVIVQGVSDKGAAKKRDVESLRTALREYSKKASPGPDLAKAQDERATGTESEQRLGRHMGTVKRPATERLKKVAGVYSLSGERGEASDAAAGVKGGMAAGGATADEGESEPDYEAVRRQRAAKYADVDAALKNLRGEQA